MFHLCEIKEFINRLDVEDTKFHDAFVSIVLAFHGMSQSTKIGRVIDLKVNMLHHLELCIWSRKIISNC